MPIYCSPLSLAKAWCQAAQKFTGGISTKLCGKHLPQEGPQITERTVFSIMMMMISAIKVIYPKSQGRFPEKYGHLAILRGVEAGGDIGIGEEGGRFAPVPAVPLTLRPLCLC